MFKKNCCVPLCDSRKGEKGKSFHQIPSDKKLRSEWLRRISRADSENPQTDWIPSDWSSVCSDHFLENDFAPNFKIKRLKRDAIPSIFKGYPAYMIGKKKFRKPPTLRAPLSDTTNLPLSNSTNLPPVSSAFAVPPTQYHQDEFNFNEFRRNPRLEADIASINDIMEYELTPPASNHSSSTTSLELEIKSLKKTVSDLRKKVHLLAARSRRYKEKVSNLESQIDDQNKKCQHHMHFQIQKLLADADDENVKACLLLQEIEAYGRNNFRWSELCVRMAILLKAKSPRAYIFARNHMFNLPSVTTLRRFAGPSHLQLGIPELAIKRLEMEAESLNDCEKICSLIFDEMSIKPKLEYNKQADKIVGAAQYGKTVNETSVVLANRLLCFVLKGLGTNYRIPVAYFLVKQLQGNDLAQLVSQVINKMEELGFCVCRIVCDDSSVNVKALEIFCGGTLSHVISHPVRSNDKLFISFDPCHILKNLRNQLMDPKRKLKNNGKSISGDPIRKIYTMQKGQPIKHVRFLTQKVVHPTSFEKMNVKRALLIFSPEVIAALELNEKEKMTGFSRISETIKFMKIVNKWFSIHNVCNRTHYIHSRNDDKQHFWMVDDDRLQWLEGEFLSYLENWKSYADSISKNAFLTRETYQALKICTLSTVNCIRYLLESGFHYVLTRKMTSDDIEGIFSAVRGAQGYNDQTNAKGSISALEMILKTGIFSSKSYGNHSFSSKDDILATSRNTNVLSTSFPQSTILSFNKKQQVIMGRLEKASSKRDYSAKSCGAAMIAGFLIRLLKKKHTCDLASSRYLGDHHHKNNQLIWLLDRGGLQYPSPELVNIVEAIFDLLDAADLQCFTEALRKSWSDTIQASLPTSCLICGCGNNEHTNTLRKIILSNLCKIYFNNTCLSTTDILNQTPTFSFKPCSKKVKKL